MFAVSNLFVGKRSYKGLMTRELVILGNLVTGSFFAFIRFAYLVKKDGYYFKWEESCFRNPDTNGILWIAVAAQLFEAVFYFFGGYLIVLSFEYTLYAGLNQGVISSIFSFNSLLMTIFGFLIFGEQLTEYHYAGICGMIL